MGKSSVTLQLALSLSLQGKSVGILDIDLTGPSMPRLVGLENAKITQSASGWEPVVVHPSDQSSRGSLRCMSLGFLLRDRGDSVIWRGPKKTAMIRQFLTDVSWGETDYLLIDTPPGTSDEHIALAEQLLTHSSTVVDPSSAKPHLAGAVLVTTPQAIATSDVRKEINFCAKTNIPALGVIENMSGYACPCCGEVSNVFSSGGGRVMAEQAGIPFLGSVPVDVKFGEMVEADNVVGYDSDDSESEGVPPPTVQAPDERPLVEKYLDCPSASTFVGLARSLISRIEGATAG